MFLGLDVITGGGVNPETKVLEGKSSGPPLSCFACLFLGLRPVCADPSNPLCVRAWILWLALQLAGTSLLGCSSSVLSFLYFSIPL